MAGKIDYDKFGKHIDAILDGEEDGDEKSKGFGDIVDRSGDKGLKHYAVVTHGDVEEDYTTSRNPANAVMTKGVYVWDGRSSWFLPARSFKVVAEFDDWFDMGDED